MTAFGQDMSYFTAEYTRADGTFAERLILLETIRSLEMTGIGEFYETALRFLLARAPDIRTNTERSEAERSVVILAEGLGNERHTAAAAYLWQAVELFDVNGNANDGNAMQSALIAISRVDGRDFIPHIVNRLNAFNIQNVRNAEQRRRVQMAVIGCINALETFKDIRGYRVLFHASIGPYDAAIREIAFNALPNITDDPADEIIAIIQDPVSDPQTKLTAWREMFRTTMPDASKAKVAAAALETGWFYQTSNRNFQGILREMRKSAITLIRQVGAADESVYINLDRSYRTNFGINNPDYDEIMLTLNALAAIRSERAVGLIHGYIREVNLRRRAGPWGEKERRVFEWLMSSIGVTGTQSPDVRLLLTTISRNTAYTPHERNLATSALTALGQ